VSDILVMGGCLILESLVLFHWCESNGLGPLGVTGMSMGGHVSAFYLSCIHVCVNPVSVLRTAEVTDVTNVKYISCTPRQSCHDTFFL